MSTAPHLPISPEEYLAIERKAKFRSEYYAGEMFAMAGASWEHTLIKDNLAREIGQQLKGGPCHVSTSDLRVKVRATGLYAYPDVIVVCEKPRFEDNEFDTLLNPQVVIEVLSDSTEKYDRGTKFRNYRKLPSVQEYILVAQERPLLERYVRQDNGDWNLTEFKGPAGTFQFATIPVRISLAEIYRGVEFPETSPD